MTPARAQAKAEWQRRFNASGVRAARDRHRKMGGKNVLLGKIKPPPALTAADLTGGFPIGSR